MTFEKVATEVDFPAQERSILELWRRLDAFEKLRARNRGRARWSFLDGPITANNPMGVHHAWGRTYKDAFQRYFAMTGHDQRYQNGFDCQGLWVEVEVEKELGLKTKRDIEELVPGDRFASMDRFVQLCKDRVDRFARVQTEQSIRLGYWMDWDRAEDWSRPPDERRSYYTMSAENNYAIWSFLKKCHGRGLIYRGSDAMPWCPRCAVGLSQMEMHEGYQRVAHRAVFVRFPLRGRPDENLLIWTTTPWTLSSNVAAAVNPNLTYLMVRHRGQVYILAKGALTVHRLEEEFRRKEWIDGVPKLKTLEQLFREKGGFEIVGKVSGAEMLGWTYDGPFDEFPAAQESPRTAVRGVSSAAALSARDAHRVIAWDAVGETEGTGIVHIAPGCGKEDFQLGRDEKLPVLAPLDECGQFLPGFGPLEGMSAVDSACADWIIAELERKDLLFAVERYPHSYPHCWRCKTELLFRLVDEWFIDMRWRDEIMQVVEDVTFLPESINGKARELDWLRNMGDWMISKKRYWGLALPIWVCESCGAFDVIGGRDELERRAVAGWDRFAGRSPHRPWIDLVQVRCEQCGGTASRVPDVGNPWLDAGIVPYSTMKYNTDRAYWEKWFPADLITECFPGQFRNWFYAILAMSTMLEGRAPFRVLLGHALVRDEKGEEMHKSKGNAIPFEEAAEKMSADLMRWMFARHNPANNINFGYGPAKELRNKFIMKLWNSYAFFCNYARIDQFDPGVTEVSVANRPDLDRWILSDLQLLIETARREFQRFNLMGFCLEAEKFVDDKLSNWYVRRNRRRFWKSEQGADKLAAYQTLHTVLVTLVKLFAPIMPFLAEAIYQNLARAGSAPGASAPAGSAPESVHLCDYPASDPAMIDSDLSADMEALLRLVSLGSAARNAVKIKVRQPLAAMRVLPGSDRDRRAVERFADQIAEELNLKKLELHDPADGPLLTQKVSPNLKTLGPKFGSRLKEVIDALNRLEAGSAPGASATGGADRSVVLQLSDGPVVLGADDLIVQWQAPEGWSGVEDRGTQVLVDARLTPELELEGLAREIVRHVQELRKKVGLEMEDRIVLRLDAAAPKLRQVLETHRSHISAETLTIDWSPQPLAGQVDREEITIDGQRLTIELRRVAAGS